MFIIYMSYHNKWLFKNKKKNVRKKERNKIKGELCILFTNHNKGLFSGQQEVKSHLHLLVGDGGLGGGWVSVCVRERKRERGRGVSGGGMWWVVC